MNNFRIFQVSFGDGYAGSARAALNTSFHLSALGHELTLFVSEGSLTQKRAEEKRINQAALDSRKGKKYLFGEIERRFTAKKPDFIISYHSLDRKIGSGLKRAFGKEFINIAYRQNISESFPFIGAIAYNWFFDYQIACSRGVAESLSASGISRRKIVTIHNGIEMPGNSCKSADDNIRNKYGIGDKTVLGVSSWFHRKRKGFDIMFSAFSGLPENFILMIIGISENDRNDLMKMARDFGVLPDRLLLPGYVENIYDYYGAMDIFLLPSRSEGFSLALLEAAAAKIPVIASDIPGNDEFVRDGENGFLFNLRDIEGFRKKIVLLAEDKTLKNKFSEAAYKTVVDGFTSLHQSEKLEQFLIKAYEKNENR